MPLDPPSPLPLAPPKKGSSPRGRPSSKARESGWETLWRGALVAESQALARVGVAGREARLEFLPERRDHPLWALARGFRVMGLLLGAMLANALLSPLALWGRCAPGFGPRRMLALYDRLLMACDSLSYPQGGIAIMVGRLGVASTIRVTQKPHPTDAGWLSIYAKGAQGREPWERGARATLAHELGHERFQRGLRSRAWVQRLARALEPHSKGLAAKMAEHAVAHSRADWEWLGASAPLRLALGGALAAMSWALSGIWAPLGALGGAWSWALPLAMGVLGSGLAGAIGRGFGPQSSEPFLAFEEGYCDCASVLWGFAQSEALGQERLAGYIALRESELPMNELPHKTLPALMELSRRLADSERLASALVSVEAMDELAIQCGARAALGVAERLRAQEQDLSKLHWGEMVVFSGGPVANDSKRGG